MNSAFNTITSETKEKQDVISESVDITADNTPKIIGLLPHSQSEVQEVSKDASTKTELSVPANRLKLKPEQSYKKETKASRLGKSTGRWSKQEHVLFIEGLKIYGKNWKKVESYIGTRTGTQIRSHAQKFFNRIRKEHHTEDASKFVIDNMSDETIKKIVLEHCGEGISNKDDEKDSSEEDTPEVLFVITKDKSSKRPSESGSPTAKSSQGIKSAFKRFKRVDAEEDSNHEDSKFSVNESKVDVSPATKIARPVPIMNPGYTHILGQMMQPQLQQNLMYGYQSLNTTALLMNILMSMNTTQVSK